MQLSRQLKRKESQKGFTLIEILIVIGMLAILATVVLVAINPLRQFAQARNSQRQANVSAILNAVSNRIADNRGIFESNGCTVGVPTTTSMISSGIDGADLRPCLVPAYISELPIDPAGGLYMNDCKDASCAGGMYNTGYQIEQDKDTSRITVCAPESVESALGLTNPDDAFCLTR